MPEMKNFFQGGKMNKDLDERLIPSSEYRDALNVEVTTSDNSEVGALQTIKGNTLLSNLASLGPNQGFTCVGSIADHKNDKLYFMVAGFIRDLIIEYDSVSKSFLPVCVDNHGGSNQRALNFNANFLITGINIVDDLLIWTDNNSEPKRINITRGKAGSSSISVHTDLMVRDTSLNAQPNSYIADLDQNGVNIQIQEKHLTVIRKGPPVPPVLEMVDTEKGDWDGDTLVGGNEVSAPVILQPGETWLDTEGEWNPSVLIHTMNTTDFHSGIYLNIFSDEDPAISVRVYITGGGGNGYTVDILSGDKNIIDAGDLTAELEQADALFQFKFCRFATRYKYEDGEYSAFSPFTQPAFLPGKFYYLPKEGYNLGMVNRLRSLVVKDFVHSRAMDNDVVSIDILYKESNSTNIYSIKTIKRRDHDPLVWDEWNAISNTQVSNRTKDPTNKFGDGWLNLTTGYLPIKTELIHAVLPANQLLRPWDNVPRKALAQEVIGNRLVYGNYLQNYDLKNFDTGDSYIKVNIDVGFVNSDVGTILLEEIHAGMEKPYNYYPAKSVKSLRTYQIGVVYIDKYGRETPVFSEDKRGITAQELYKTDSSVYIPKKSAKSKNQLHVQLKNNPPDWATSFKFFIKETSNEYYNLAMDRWYNAEDGNVWLSFPSAERNKMDSETFLILKKEHDNNTDVKETARYKVIAIENEAPPFIKLTDISIGALTDDATFDDDTSGSGGGMIPFGSQPDGFPLVGGFKIHVDSTAFDDAGWDVTLLNSDYSTLFFRVKSASGRSKYYRVKSVAYDGAVGTGVYVITSGKKFGGDMSHTSPDDTFANRIRNATLEVIKRVPEDKPEFQGRFFAKIVKDSTLQEKLHMILPPGDGLSAISSMKVQYISPTDSAVSGTHKWDGFGTWQTNTAKGHHSISKDEKNNSLWAIPTGINGSDEKGDEYWKMAANYDGPGTQTESSGWFIDKVEAFRPFSKVGFKKDDAGVRRNAQDTSTMNVFAMQLYTSYGNNPDNMKKMLQGSPIDTYQGAWGQNYLSTTDLKQNYSAVDNGTIGNGGGVGPSLGIDTALNIIHLSYAGLNDNGTNGDGPTTLQNANWAFKTGSKHVDDITWIEKLIEPGTAWRWREDPDQVLYVTKSANLIDTTTTAYTTNNLTKDSGVDLDGAEGVYLFNYTCFSDYSLNVHHTRMILCSCWVFGFWVSCGSSNLIKEDWASRNIGDHPPQTFCGPIYLASVVAQDMLVSLLVHPGTSGAACWGSVCNWTADYKFPNGIYNWNHQHNRRRRFVIHAETLIEKDPNNGDAPFGLGGFGHKYLPTNDPSFLPHFDVNLNPITEIPGTTTPFPNPAPGIRTDGMYTGHTEPNTYQYNDGTGNGAQPINTIPQYKSYDADDIAMLNAPGSVTWEIMMQFDEDPDNFSSKNPAIWETEPKEDVGLDIYHEVGQIYPIDLNDETIEQFVGAVHKNAYKNSFVKCWDPPYAPGGGAGTLPLNTGVFQFFTLHDIRVIAAYDNYVMLGSVVVTSQFGVLTTSVTPLDHTNGAHAIPTAGSYLMFLRADGGRTQAHVGSGFYTDPNPFLGTSQTPGTWWELLGNWVDGDVGVHNKFIRLPWFNCYSFDNGVESDRIRDDYNQVTIDNGPKASTTLEGPYLEERRKNGFIWSGLYNSTSGVNNTNQFIQAEKITKDTNPTYGSIQKLHARDSDLVAFCEDRILKVQANKDALYNADGSTNVVATNRVLGSIKPFIGDYGISLNPESFAVDSYRAYFTDTSRGAVLRLSQDGITPISDYGMKDWFKDNLKGKNRIIGSYDEEKAEYNLTLKEIDFTYTIAPDLSTAVNVEIQTWDGTVITCHKCVDVSGNSFVTSSNFNVNAGDSCPGGWHAVSPPCPPPPPQ